MRLFLFAVCLGLLGFASTEGYADPGSLKPAGSCDTPCSGCSKILICCPSTTIEKEKKTCFEVECEHICVPQVNFSWKQLCALACGLADPCEPAAPACGKIITVKKLKKENYEVDKVVYKWEIKETHQLGCCKP
ncbi:hypothetical protein Pla110_10530 [Polystyrenella longa]|uniref:4Fe-4S ferredoxin-type domain-containing protein n=1 Tax=Polystyrenella longa TaxID=2528007 RepID=A0A518CJE8_9PLAN|nr:hypothetical protein [Polystyrenella longa]QDU79345.1 hypothetical protein Pla110_10530 [Polystyrenella longa]